MLNPSLLLDDMYLNSIISCFWIKASDCILKCNGVSLCAETEAKGESDRLSEQQLAAMVNQAELVKITCKHTPSGGTLAFWYPEAQMENTELEVGHEVRLKTRGNSPFICKVKGLPWFSTRLTVTVTPQPIDPTIL